MAKEISKFRHDSLQNTKSIKALIDALSKGIAKGEVTLSDENGTLVLEPEGLLNLRIKAERGDGQCRVDLRITWHDDSDTPTDKTAPKIS